LVYGKLLKTTTRREPALGGVKMLEFREVGSQRHKLDAARGELAPGLDQTRVQGLGKRLCKEDTRVVGSTVPEM